MLKFPEKIVVLILLSISCKEPGTNKAIRTADSVDNCRALTKTGEVLTDSFKWDGFSIDETDEDIDSLFFVKFLSGLGFDFIRWKEGSQTIYRSGLTPTLKENNCHIVIKCINRIDYPVNSLFLIEINEKPKIITELAGISVYPDEGCIVLSSEIVKGEIIRQTKISRSYQHKILDSTTFDFQWKMNLKRD